MKGTRPSDETAVECDEKKIDAIFAEFDQCHLPGIAVGIAIGGKPVYRKGFGLASMELPLVLSPSMRIRIGSTTKQFTCLAYMLLCEEGKAGIDDPIGKHLPEVHPVARGVTMRQVMGNISGLRDAMAIRSQFSGHIGVALPQVPSAQLLSLYGDMDDLNATPGTTWIYNNGGFGLLSAAIERITGQPFEQVMWERVLEPLGMYDSLVRRWDTNFVPNSATGHDILLSGSFSRAYYGFSYDGAGTIVSTVNDMLRWLANMDTHVVGDAGTWEVMKEPQTLANGTVSGYGLGLMIGCYRGVETVHHAGGWVGTNTQMLKVPAVKLDVVVMANRDDVSSSLLVNEVLDACVRGLDPVRAPCQGPYVMGIFCSPTTGRVIELFPRAGQQIASIDGSDVPVEPNEEGVLWPTGTLTYLKKSVTLIGNPEKPSSIQLSDFGNLDHLVPLQSVQEPDVRAIAGRYRSVATGTELTIFDTNNGARMTSTGLFGTKEFSLACIAAGIWKVQPRDFSAGILLFDSGADFHYSDNNTRALPFRRLA